MDDQTATATSTSTAAAKKIFLTINCLLVAIGNIGGPLIVRFYFLHGGKRVWFTGWLHTAGWPFMLITLLVSYTRRRRTTVGADLFCMNSRVFTASAALGVLIGFNSYLFNYGLSKLPFSTSSLLSATQLVFAAAFGGLIMKQKFTAYSINAVVLLTAGAVVLGLQAGGDDRPVGDTDKEYWLGFAAALVAAAVYGLCLPLVQLTYKKAKQTVTYALVMEIQLVNSFFATAFGTVGMIINNDFQAIPREAREFEFGVRNYYLVVVCIAIFRHCSSFGVIGVIFYSSSLFSGIIISICLPITQVLAVIFYNERFQEEKGISLFLSLWGFVSYYCGGLKQKNRDEEFKNDDQIMKIKS